MHSTHWRLGSILAIVLTGLAAPTAYGQSFGVELNNTLMPASGGMAGTSIARPQDLISGINANPAALTQYHGTQFTVGGTFAGSTFDIAQSSNIPLEGITPFAAKSGTPGAAVPNLGVSQELTAYGLPVTLGLGLFGAAGAGTSFIKQPQSNGTSSYLSLLEIAPSLGVQLTERFSVGSTLFVGNGFLDGPFVGTGSMTNAYALRGSVGAGYQLTENTSLGLYYQSVQRFRFKDEVVLFNDTASRDVHLSLPDQTGLGIANSSLMDGRLLLAADLLFLDWKDAALFRSIYRNQWVLQLGTQYRVNNRVKLRLGYAYAENPLDPSTGTSVDGITLPGGIPAVKYLQAQFAVINQHRLSAGFGVSDVLPGLDFDTFAGGMFQASDLLGNFTQVSVESYWIGLGFTWRFNRGACPSCPPQPTTVASSP
jgi:long-chain fatty acid transport protein